MALNIQDLSITSSQFAFGDRLADVNANDHDNVAPELNINGVPETAVELALVCHDPDAPLPFGFTHWTLYNVPTDTITIGVDADERFNPGPNSFGAQGYGGPQPPPGHGPHHYYFWVYALSRAVDGKPDRETFLREYGDDIIEQNRIVGVYER